MKESDGVWILRDARYFFEHVRLKFFPSLGIYFFLATMLWKKFFGGILGGGGPHITFFNGPSLTKKSKKFALE